MLFEVCLSKPAAALRDPYHDLEPKGVEKRAQGSQRVEVMVWQCLHCGHTAERWYPA